MPAADILLLIAGLSRIIDAIKESRGIFQRMNNYALHRIAAYWAFGQSSPSHGSTFLRTWRKPYSRKRRRSLTTQEFPQAP